MKPVNGEPSFYHTEDVFIGHVGGCDLYVDHTILGDIYSNPEHCQPNFVCIDGEFIDHRIEELFPDPKDQDYVRALINLHL